MTVTRRPAPRLLRAVNALFDRSPIDLVPLELDAIRTQAEWTTECHDYGDPRYLERLAAMVANVRQHSNLTTTGRIAQRIFYQWHVTNRLREVDFLKLHPEVLDIELPAPVIIVGGYRTGTTHLHTLLTQDPQFRAPRTWEVCFPTPLQADAEADRRRRRRNTRAVFALNQFIMPDQGEVHKVLLDGPEECHFLLENAALSMTNYISFGGLDYARWLLEQDVSDAYDSMKAQYQMLTWWERQQNPGAPDKPWLLKCPLHTWYLEDLMRVFPDARLIWTHRRMNSTVGSTCGLSAVTASKFFGDVSGKELGDFWVDYYVKGFDRALRARDAHPEWNPLDVHLKQLGAEPYGELERIYKHLGLEFTPESRENVGTYLDEQSAARDAPGKHRYTAEEFGQTEESIDAAFSDYHSRFGVV